MDIVDEVLALLSDEPLTMKEMSDATGMNYYTLRKYLKPAIDDGRIIPINRQRRNIRYTVGTSNSPNLAVPSLSFKGTAYNSTVFLTLEEDENLVALAEKAGTELLSALANVFNTVESVGRGTGLDVVETMLSRQRMKLRAARTNFEALALLADQIMGQEKFWNPIHLEKMLNDPSYQENKEIVSQIVKTLDQ